MDKDSIAREINRIIRGVNWRMRWRTFCRGCNEILGTFLCSALVLIKISPLLMFFFLVYAFFHFIFKYW